MSIADEIRKLTELRDAGTLTEGEYETAKARVLASGENPQASVFGAAGAKGTSGAFGAASSAFASTTSAYPPGASTSERVEPTLRRSRSDRWFGGVCGGLARYTRVESWIWRLIFTLCFFFAGFGLLPYVLLWIFVPLADD